MTSPNLGDSQSAPLANSRRPVDWLIALLWGAAIVATTFQHGWSHQHNNFLIFRAASRHLLQGADLYAAYPTLHADFYKYSPTFALLFLPFAFLPFSLAMLLWNALNAGALFIALGMVLPRRAASIARAIAFLDMLGSLQNVQSNALVAALIILTFAAYERHHTVLGTATATVGAYIKIFPLAAVSFAIFHPRKVRVAVAVLVGLITLALLPLLVTSPATLLAQYASWHAIEARDALHRGFTVMQMVQQLLGTAWPNWPQQLIGVLILIAPVVAQPSRWREWELRRLYLCSVLVFCVIFNHQSESPTFIIGVAGAAIWFATLTQPTKWEWALLGFIVVCTILASSDVMPKAVQRDLFDAYYFKTVPLIVLWLELQRRLWQAPSRIALDSKDPAHASQLISPK